MKKGILQVLLFYIVGFICAGIAYKTVPHTYMHAPALHQFIIFLILIISFVWTLITLFVLFIFKKSEALKGLIYTNSTILLCFFLYIYITVNL